MRILFTGASSFTGYWFIKELAQAGHAVVATFQSSREGYAGLRKQRVEEILSSCDPVFSCSFGTDKFMDVIRTKGPFTALCHHAADVRDYRSPDFDVAQALAANTRNSGRVLDLLQEHDCRKLVLTGSVFEANEGAGSDLWKAFSPYGLSKGFTADLLRMQASQKNMKMGKFVIPNPFGPLEEARFTSYLMQNWAEGKIPAINTPLYVRDNIHVSLLAKAYVCFVENLSDECPRFERLLPSGYVESQGDFSLRFAKEMQQRLGLPCLIEKKPQTQFLEPKIRVNTDLAAALPIEWNESAAWDELAKYYQQIYAL